MSSADPNEESPSTETGRQYRNTCGVPAGGDAGRRIRTTWLPPEFIGLFDVQLSTPLPSVEANFIVSVDAAAEACAAATPAFTVTAVAGGAAAAVAAAAAAGAFAAEDVVTVAFGA